MMRSRRIIRPTPRVLLFAATAASTALGLLVPSARLWAAPPDTQPAPVPANQVFAAWATAGLFRLESMRYAAEEAPLEDSTKQKLIDRVRKARDDVDAAAAQYAAGTLRGAAARKAVDGILSQLDSDVNAMLGDRAAAFAGRVSKTMGDAQLFAARDPANAQVILEASVKLSDEQKARLEPILADASARVKEIEAGGKLDALALKHRVGFQTRSAVRALLTPEQQKAFDGPFETAAASAGAPASSRPPAGRPATGPGAPTAPAAPGGANEARAVTLGRLEAMRYAALEGPFRPEVKAALAERIAKGRADVLESATAGAAGAAGGEGPASADSRVSRAYNEVLADASKLLDRQTTEFIRRQDRIYQDVSDLAADGPWAGREALEALKLTPAQKAQVDQILSRRAEQLKALSAATGPAPGEAPADPIGEHAARSLRRREVAFQTRAALRAVLTPEQQAAWDAANP